MASRFDLFRLSSEYYQAKLQGVNQSTGQQSDLILNFLLCCKIFTKVYKSRTFTLNSKVKVVQTDYMTLSRRLFIKNNIEKLVISFSVLVLLPSCKSGSGSATDTPADTGAIAGGHCQTNGTSITIESNHGHTLTVSTADVIAGTQKAYDITGTAGHTHSVTITAAQFTQLMANQGVQVTSTTSGHTHTVTVNCV